MKFFSRKNKPKKPELKPVTEPTLVVHSANDALKRYRKTFLDLARYDRGEPILVPR